MDYIPNADGDFNLWQIQFMGGVQPNLTAWGIPTATFTALQALQTPWTTTWAKASDTNSHTSSDVQAKNDARAPYEKSIRAFVQQYLAHNNAVSNTQKQNIAITVPSGSHGRVAAPTTQVPHLAVDSMQHLQHTLRITSLDNPTSRAKPAGIRVTRIYCFVGTAAPTDITQYHHLGNATRFLYNVNYTLADVGKTAWYIACYENTRGEPGIYCQPLGVLIA